MQNIAPMFNPEPIIQIHKDIRFHPKLTFGERMFYAEIQSLIQQNEKKRVHYSSRKLSQLFGVSHQTIVNWIRKLCDMDVIEVGIDYSLDQECRNFLKLKASKKSK